MKFASLCLSLHSNSQDTYPNAKAILCCCFRIRDNPVHISPCNIYMDSRVWNYDEPKVQSYSTFELNNFRDIWNLKIFRMSCNQPDTYLDWLSHNHNIPNNDPQNVHELLYWLKKIFLCWKFCGISLNINYFWIPLVNSREESEVIIKCLIQSFFGELSVLNSHSFNLCIYFDVYYLMEISVESTMEKAGAVIKSLKRKWTSCVRKR